MGLLELLALAIILYWLVYVILWVLLDCNVDLWWKERFGLPIASLRGQVVWITGASSGIGRALALTLAKNGVHLVLSARRESQLQEVCDQCLKESNGLLSSKDILVLPMDMLDIEKHQTCFDQVLKHFGCLDILVNNAGRSQRANWEDIKVQVDRDLFELDVFSIMHLSRIVVRYFNEEKSGHGHLAVTSSVAGMTPVAFSATYCAAKHAISAYLRALKLEHPSIDVTIFSPGPIATDFLEEAFTADPQKKVGTSSKHNKNRMSVERCGHLFGVTLANKILLSWCGVFPVVLLAYVTQYQCLRKIFYKVLGKQYLVKVREGNGK